MRRSATELRGQILDAARAEFAHRGLAGSRIDRIAREAHASKERLYAHFGDKEALFREVVDTDVAAFYRSVTLRPDAVPEFAGDVYDLGRNSPEHLRMITWARLEGLALDEPHADGQALFEHAVTAIETAQTDGHVDSSWEPLDLLALLFGIGLAWAHSPDPYETLTDRAVIARQRRAAVEAARRVVSAPCG
ncbi:MULTISPECIES: TetR family transcriptional regulator [Mycolicibacter]|uniref:TetR/AcrR family transcriptional regulator n=1 Tax=Mycolicibacter virginiensis TaxID=1795032 RepID=A0A9X7INN2_9MYCO|nr:MULTISPECIES: TetR family transcriptional regulator [Mycolicibacter]OBJ33401.1 TetR family transcriptional regulator [Mycolicibacter heraklionensis]PQM52617.1 TetR/AcrR family transcriptional regulator [Mycolicibacter virginiensis]